LGLFLVLSPAFEETDEIDDREQLAEDGQPDPEQTQGEDVDDEDDCPEDDRNYLGNPKDRHIGGEWHTGWVS
jgi:hypothetical protein